MSCSMLCIAPVPVRQLTLKIFTTVRLTLCRLYQALMRSTLCIISRNGLHQLLLHIAAARQHDIFYFTRLIILLRNKWP